jgi:hypothetical protein
MNEFFEDDLFIDEEDDFFGAYLDDDVEELRLAPASVVPSITTADYMRASRNYWMFIPMPDEVVSDKRMDLTGLSDEELLTIPVHLLVHAMRTNASGGLQVISPRQTPLAMCAGRTNEPDYVEDMYVAGSVAPKASPWHTVDGYIDDPQLLGESVDAGHSELSHRSKTHVERLFTAPIAIEDPVAKAFLTARSMVDLQRRPDVDGDAEALAATFCQMWGVEYEDLFSTSEASLAPPGDLIRYAIGPDDKYPMLNAPVHSKRSISVGSFGHEKARYGPHAAVDWRRIRVLCESVFYISTRLENYFLKSLTLVNPPGSLSVPPDRDGVLQFRARPGSVWSYAPETFALKSRSRVYDVSTKRVTITARVVGRLNEVVGSLCPLAVSSRHKVVSNLVPANLVASTARSGEGIVTGYISLMKRMSTFAAHGRTAGATVRNFLFEHLSAETTPAMTKALWLVCDVIDISVAYEIPISRDMDLVREIASHFAPVCFDIRQKMASEAARRGADLYEWWLDLRWMLPSAMKSISEGSMSWALASAWFMLNPPTAKWTGLSYALKMARKGSLAIGFVGKIALPAAVRSPERVRAAAEASFTGIRSKFTAYYSARSESCWLMSRRRYVVSSPVLVQQLQVVGAMWSIRARLVSSMKINWDEVANLGIMNSESEGYTYSLTTAPYSSYEWMRRLALSSSFVPREVKRALPEQVAGPVSEVFSGFRAPWATPRACPDVMRYLVQPYLLCRDMNRTVVDVKKDIDSVLRHYATEEREVWNRSAVEAVEIQMVDMSVDKPTGNIHDRLSELPYPDNEYYIGLLDSLPEDVTARLSAESYPDGPAAAWAVEEEQRERISKLIQETIT